MLSWTIHRPRETGYQRGCQIFLERGSGGDFVCGLGAGGDGNMNDQVKGEDREGEY